MRIPGYCTGCRRVRTVSVSGHGLAMAGRGVAQGICADCQQGEEDARRAAHVARPFLGKRVVVKLWRGADVEGTLERVGDRGALVLLGPDGRALPHVPIRDVRHLTRPAHPSGTP